MMRYIFSLFLSFFILAQGYAVQNDIDENSPVKAPLSTPPSSPHKSAPSTPVSPSFLESPITGGEKRSFRCIREYVAVQKALGNKKTAEMKKEMEERYKENFPRNYWCRKVQFSINAGGGVYTETVYQQDALFDIHMPVVRKVDGVFVWLTNLEWMAMGKAPIAYRGRVALHSMSDKEARSFQKKWGIELHHFLQTQAKHGLGEMSRPGHHGTNDRAVYNKKTKELSFFPTLDEAENHPGEMLTDNLHLVQKSEITRSLFSTFRENYWKYRSKLIKEDGVYTYRPEKVKRLRLFEEMGGEDELPEKDWLWKDLKK